MEQFKEGSFVIDIQRECAPREIVTFYCEHCKKNVTGMRGTTDGVTIPVTDYNRKLYKVIQ